MSLINKIFAKFFWGQHTEAALRYAPVVAEIKGANLEKSKILEIGPGSSGIIPYLKVKIDGVDIDFSGEPQTDLLNKIKGSAVDLPFRKNSYDVSISVDVLEHLKDQDRQKAIFEQLRVTRKLALIVVPVGTLSHQQDKEMEIRWDKIFAKKNKFLSEHVENGLPTTHEILVGIDSIARKLGKNVKVKSYPNLNLTVRKILMYTWITKNKLLYYLYLKGFLILLPILKFANFGNCYRKVFVIELAPHQISK